MKNSYGRPHLLLSALCVLGLQWSLELVFAFPFSTKPVDSPIHQDLRYERPSMQKQWLSQGFDQQNDTLESWRRKYLLRSLSLVPALLGLPVVATTTETYAPSPIANTSVTIPLYFNGQELLIRYRVDGSLFQAVVDTGSPFLMIPGSCGENTVRKSGCYKKQGIPSGYKDTYEQFDGFEGPVEWRQAPVSFEGAEGHLFGPERIVFGVASESILSGPGGVFFGLIRDTDRWIRPSFLSQTNIQSLLLDLRSPANPEAPRSQRYMTLSTSPLIPPEMESKAIRLTDDLRRKYGDPVTHYTVKADSIEVNGYPLAAKDGRPIYVILDTGTTGMVVSQELFDQRYQEARQRKEKSLWGQVALTMTSTSGTEYKISATRPLTTPFDLRKTWGKRFKGHLLVIGLSFLEGHQMTIDMDQKLVLFQDDSTGKDPIS